MTQIEFPEMRQEVISALTSLGDRTYQQRVWVDHNMPNPNYYDDLDVNIHILFDDIDVCRDPERWVGGVLYPREVEALGALGATFGSVIDDLGDVPDAEYLAHHDWDDVIRLARVALVTMTGKNPGDLVAQLGSPAAVDPRDVGPGGPHDTGAV